MTKWSCLTLGRLLTRLALLALATLGVLALGVAVAKTIGGIIPAEHRIGKPCKEL